MTVDVESQQACVTNVSRKPVRVTWGSVDYPRAGPLQPGQRVILPIHIANHFAKYHPPMVVGEGEDVRVETRVEVQPYDGETELQPTAAAVKQVFKDEETGIAYETLEAYTAALKARFMAATTQGPQSPPPAAAAVSAPVFPTAPTLQGQAKNEPPSFTPNIPNR